MCYAEEHQACQFSGIVTGGDSKLPGGIRITATISGDEYHTHTPINDNSSSYTITIRSPEGIDYPNGTEIFFSIEGYATEQIGNFIAGTNNRLDLTSTAYQAAPSNRANLANPHSNFSYNDEAFNWWIVIGLTAGVLFASGMIYYIIILRRVARKAVEEKQRLLQILNT